MDFTLPILDASAFKPLHVDTSIVYGIDERKFPGLEKYFHQYEPSLIISPEFLDANLTSESYAGIQDDLYDILDSMDFTEEDVNCQTANIVEEILDTVMYAEETPAVSCDVSRFETCEYNQENSHNTYSSNEYYTSQKYSDISKRVSSSAKGGRVSESRFYSMCCREDSIQKSNRKRRLSGVSDNECSKRRKMCVNDIQSTDFYKSVAEGLFSEIFYPISDVITECVTFPRDIFGNGRQL